MKGKQQKGIGGVPWDRNSVWRWLTRISQSSVKRCSVVVLALQGSEEYTNAFNVIGLHSDACCGRIQNSQERHTVPAKKNCCVPSCLSLLPLIQILKDRETAKGIEEEKWGKGNKRAD